MITSSGMANAIALLDLDYYSIKNGNPYECFMTHTGTEPCV